jgi:hypothetical protein
MKKIFYPLIFLVVSCSEDYIGQYPVDKIPPGKVTNPVVTNFAGGSEISYDLPLDDDLLYVKAKYVLSNGNQTEERASFLLNSVKIKGFGKSQKSTVELIAVDRSENESQSVKVEIEPEDSPIYSILSTLSVLSSWGGLKVEWENPDAENIVVGLISKTNKEDSFSGLDNFYTAEKNASKAVRGMDTVQVTVGVFVRDRYDNYSDTAYSIQTPLFEQQLEGSKFKGLPQSPNYPLHASFGSKDLKVLWDSKILPDDNVYYIAPGGNPNPYFTMDLGVTARLSRFKFWSRQAWVFQLHSPKHFEIWGTNDPAATAVDNWEGWYKMMDQEAYRPSGLAAGAAPTADDLTYAAAGEEYEFDITNSPVRYIRFRCTETWGGSTGLNLTEIAFWGAEQ